jgi:hypothetical protein
LSHVEALLLSQHADGELPAAEARTVTEHLAACATCAGQLTRLRQLARTGRTAASRASAAYGGIDLPADEADRLAGCPSPSELAGWADPVLPPAERTALEHHLTTCDVCLTEVRDARHLLARLEATPALPVPSALKGRVASLWGEPAARTSALTRLVIRVTRAGAELIESHLVAPLRDLAEASTPLPAMRSDGAAKTARSFTLHGPDATIVAEIAAAADGVGVTLRLADDDGAPLPEERIFLRRHGRSLYSARTDADGVLRMPGIEHGVYEVDCPGIATSFQLDLRE